MTQRRDAAMWGPAEWQVEAPGWRRRRRTPEGRRAVWPRVFAAQLVLLLVGVLGFVSATWASAQTQPGDVLLPGTVVAGVDLGGLSIEDATATALAVVDRRFNAPMTLRWGDRTWSVTPAELGATTDLADAIAEAGAAVAAATPADRVRARSDGAGFGYHVQVTVAHSPTAVRVFVDGLAAEIDTPARSAAVDWESGWIEIVREENGRRLARHAATEAILTALADGETDVALPVRVLRPAVTTDDLSPILLLRQQDQRLYYYEGGELERSWVVSTGRSGYRTPVGTFWVGTKRFMPSWSNPAPNGWGRDMPRYIGPGPGNPLGVRALNWNDARGNDTLIRFHGTTAVGLLGRPASHGCVRLSNPDVVELYDLIDEGALIVSIR